MEEHSPQKYFMSESFLSTPNAVTASNGNMSGCILSYVINNQYVDVDTGGGTRRDEYCYLALPIFAAAAIIYPTYIYGGGISYYHQICQWPRQHFIIAPNFRVDFYDAIGDTSPNGFECGLNTNNQMFINPKISRSTYVSFSAILIAIQDYNLQ